MPSEEFEALVELMALIRRKYDVQTTDDLALSAGRARPFDSRAPQNLQASPAWCATVLVLDERYVAARSQSSGSA